MSVFKSDQGDEIGGNKGAEFPTWKVNSGPGEKYAVIRIP